MELSRPASLSSSRILGVAVVLAAVLFKDFRGELDKRSAVPLKSLNGRYQLETKSLAIAMIDSSSFSPFGSTPSLHALAKICPTMT